MSNSKSDFVIIGAGVIGLSCAHELSKQGADIILIDQSEPGLGCSFGNAGWITPCFAMPLPLPGMLLKSIKWLLDPLSPLRIQPELSFLFIRWFLRFLRSMNESTARRSIAALTEISLYSLQEYSRLEAQLNYPLSFEQKGLLMVGQTPSGLQSALHEMRCMAEHGIPGKALGEEEVRSFEPALRGPIKGGVYFPEEAHVEPYLVVKALADTLQKRGVKIVSSAEVFEFESSERKIKSIQTTRGRFQADQFVLATGSWSQALARKINLDLPILGGKGYSLIFKEFQPKPQRPIMIVDKKIAITPRKESVRVAGTLELVNQDYSINTSRVNAIHRGAVESLRIPEGSEPIELWRGLRPCTPDGVPIIGYSKYYSNLFISAGHQMLGLQSALGSAKLASDLLLGHSPSFDPTPFQVGRFSLF